MTKEPLGHLGKTLWTTADCLSFLDFKIWAEDVVVSLDAQINRTQERSLNLGNTWLYFILAILGGSDICGAVVTVTARVAP